MQRSRISAALMSVGALTVMAFGQLNLSYLNSQSVRDWKWTGTRMDSVLIETKVGNGIANTKITFSVEPQGWSECKSVYHEIPDTIWYTNYKYNTKTGKNDSVDRSFYLNWYTTVCNDDLGALDSLEISSWFTLPTDFVAKNLWLWINGKAEIAYIQDKMLAQTQYNQIVGRRMDPALLTYNGNGSYQFRMFPLKSYETRKVAIEFEHTFTDDSLNLITACIPVMFDTSSSYWYYWNGPGQQKRGITYVKANLQASDNKTYSFSMPGIGSGTFAKNSPLAIESKNVAKLGAATIATKDPSNSDVYAWGNVSEKGISSEMGFSTILAESTVVLSPEPDTRIIVLDIHNQIWDWKSYYKKQYQYQGFTWNDNYFTDEYYKPFDIWKRAQKLAVVALKSYVDNNKKFNLIINGKSVFAAPVAGSPENLATAYAAIIVASPDAKASTVTAMQKAVDQTHKDAIIFISDLMSPADGFGSCTYSSSNPSILLYCDTSANGRFYLAQIDSLKKTISTFKGNLFSICDDYNSLSTLASETGGYQLTSLRERYYYYWYNYSNYVKSDSSTNALPTLPRLYLDRGGITNITIASVNGTTTDIKYTLDGFNYWWWGWVGGPILRSAVASESFLAKKTGLAKMSLPYSYNSGNTQLLRVACMVPGRQEKTEFIITGKMGGIDFSKRITVLRQLDGDMGPAVQWAFRSAENLAQTQWNSSYNSEYWKTLQDSIKAIGYLYHIATTNTAFLALEPGMKLNIDSSMASAQNQANTKAGSMFSVSADMESVTARQSGLSLDEMTLENLINNSSAVQPKTELIKQSSDFSISLTRSHIQLVVPSNVTSQAIVLTIYDLKGRAVLSRTIAAAEYKSGIFMWDIANHSRKMSSGTYLLRINAGSIVKVMKLPTLR